MDNLRGDITKVICSEFNLVNSIVVSDLEIYSHVCEYISNSLVLPKSVKVFLVNSHTAFKYDQQVISFTENTVIFKTDPRTHELANFNEVELTLKYEDHSLKIKTSVNRIVMNHASTLLKYECGTVRLPVSNLLYPRIKLGFPQWGTIEKNDISSGTKLLEPLFTPFYDSYHKIIKYNMKSKFKQDYDKLTNIYLYDNPEVVLKVEDDGNLTRLYEASCIEVQPQRIELKPEITTRSLSRIILDIEAENDFDYSLFENQLVYFKKMGGAKSNNKATVHIKGLDRHEERLEEVVEIVEDFFTVSRKAFSKILSIKSDNNILISNYLDCRFDHYYIKDIKTSAPIVDNSLFAFHPCVLKTKNNELDNTVLHIHNINKELSEVAYKFDIECSTNKVTSLFIDEHLRVVWTDGAKMYSSVLGHDLSKDIGNHPSNNNNDVVKVSDKNTSIGDWVDISIDTDVWPDKSPMIIQIKNKDHVKYFDQESETFVDDIKYFYPQIEERFIELSVKVENASPYIINVVSDDFSKRYTASTHSNFIQSIDTKDCTGTLLLINNELEVVDTFSQSTNMIEEHDSDKIKVIIEPININSFDWSFTTLGHSFGTQGSTYSDDLYTLVSASGEGNTPVIFELDRYNVLKNFFSDSLTSTLQLSINPIYNPDEEYGFTIYVTDSNGTLKKDVQIQSSIGVITVPITFTSDTKEINNAV